MSGPLKRKHQGEHLDTCYFHIVTFCVRLPHGHDRCPKPVREPSRETTVRTEDGGQGPRWRTNLQALLRGCICTTPLNNEADRKETDSRRRPLELDRELTFRVAIWRYFDSIISCYRSLHISGSTLPRQRGFHSKFAHQPLSTMSVWRVHSSRGKSLAAKNNTIKGNEPLITEL